MTKEDKELLEVKITMYSCLAMLESVLVYKFAEMIFLSI